jgi:hypothetical protein
MSSVLCSKSTGLQFQSSQDEKILQDHISMEKNLDVVTHAYDHSEKQ